MSHKDPPRDVKMSAHETPAVGIARKYCIRWIWLLREQDTWEPHSSLLHDVPDVVRHISPWSRYPDAVTDVNILVVNENGKETQEVENRNWALIHGAENKRDNDNKNVMVNVYHHDP